MPPPPGTPNPIEGPGDYTVTKTVHSDTYPAIDPTAQNLAGRAVFITGASRGIGKAIAISFARAGASQIAIAARADLNAVAAELKAAARAAHREALPHVLCLKVEVSETRSVADAAAAVEREFGRCDIVIGNAGVFGTPGKIADVADPEEWWKVYEVNVKGQFLIARSFLPLMLRTEGGLRTLVTVASVGAHLVGPGLSQYQAGKLLNLRLAEFVDAEYASEGVSAWCAHPGNIMTDMVGGPDGEIATTMKEVFVDTPEICADTLVYLTAEKRQWLSGRYINCTWDMPELLAQKEEIVKGDKLKVRLVL